MSALNNTDNMWQAVQAIGCSFTLVGWIPKVLNAFNYPDNVYLWRL